MRNSLCHHAIIQLIVLAFLCIIQLPVCCETKNSNLRLWYKQPANEWVEALPVGNGRLGAMVFGGVERERIQFNEDTLWTGVPRDYINPKALETLPKVRQLLFEGKQRDAQRLANDMMSVPLRQEAYQPFGDIILTFPEHDQYDEYERELDLEEAIARVSYRVGNVNCRRETFSSYVDQAIVLRISADQPNAIHCFLTKTSPHSPSEIRSQISDGVGVIQLKGQVADTVQERTGQIKPSALRFESRLLVEIPDGAMEAVQEWIRNFEISGE